MNNFIYDACVSKLPISILKFITDTTGEMTNNGVTYLNVVF